MKISLVVNTYNEEKNLERCLSSASSLVDEIIVVDMHSSDNTVEIAKRFKAKVFYHKYTRYVEPARNFAIEKASGDWILLLDADEEASKTLVKILKEEAEKSEFDFIKIPRKNIIFNKWIKNSRWWPDYLVRFFKTGKVKFSKEIHIPPSVSGTELKLLSEEESAIIHHNFQSISQFLERLNRYSDIQSQELISKNYRFSWKDIIFKPAEEFFSRFFAGEGYKDGVHGLALAILQAFSETVVYLKVWEKEGFVEINLENVNSVFIKTVNDFLYWLGKMPTNLLGKIRLKIKAKV